MELPDSFGLVVWVHVLDFVFLFKVFFHASLCIIGG